MCVNCGHYTADPQYTKPPAWHSYVAVLCLLGIIAMCASAWHEGEKIRTREAMIEVIAYPYDDSEAPTHVYADSVYYATDSTAFIAWCGKRAITFNDSLWVEVNTRPTRNGR